MKRIDGATRKGLVFGKQEREDFLVAEATVGKQGNNSRDEAVGVFLLGAQESFWDVANTVAPDHDQFVFIDQVHHLGDNNAEALGCLRKGQQWFIVGQGEGRFIVGTHSLNLAGSSSNGESLGYFCACRE